MAELNKIRFLIFSLLMNFPVHALDVILSSADGNCKQQSEINSYIENGEKIYNGTSNGLIYQARNGTSKVIVYIIDISRYLGIMRNAGLVRSTRLQIVQKLKEHNYELVFLGIDNFDDDEYNLISAFLLHTIQPHSEHQGNLIIETLGENHFNRVYRCFIVSIGKYKENAQICGGRLQESLRAIPSAAFRPVGSIGKEIRLYDYHLNLEEVRWPVSMSNPYSYSLDVDVNVPQYNYKMRYPNKKICLLILGGKEYLTAIKDAERLREEAEVTRILDEMTRNDEVLLILGAFNFDWTEIDIVTQIIHRHSGILRGFYRPADNVFTCGYGMFNTVYLLNATTNASFPQQPKSNVSKLIKVLMGEEVKERVINMYYLGDDGWRIKTIPINLGDGRYIAEGEMIDYTFPWVNQKIAFIVYDSAEANNPIDSVMVYRSVKDLKQSGIYAIVIEAINFGLDDIHVVAKWIDYHRGANMRNSYRRVIHSELIAVLGAGIFDTIFQSKLTVYKTLHNTKKYELKAIRDICVKSGNGKRVFAAQIDKPRFDVWTYPMNTVNGHYEPDLIPDKNMFDTTGGKNMFFIITSANHFHRIETMQNVEGVTQWLRESIEEHYPHSNWTVFLVGLDNFGERDYHLFAELVKMQTHDERPLDKFVRTFNYGIGTPVYQYKDTRPLRSDKKSEIQMLITSFFAASR